MSKNTILEALYRMGYKGAMTGHGFRGVASTVLHEQGSKHGFLHEQIELQLAQAKRDDVSAAYDYSAYMAERTEMCSGGPTTWTRHGCNGLSVATAQTEQSSHCSAGA